MLDQIIQIFRDSQVYSVTNNGGSVREYKYFIYPFKGLHLVNLRLYRHSARYLRQMLPDNTEVILTIDSDGIAIASFIGAQAGLPMAICKNYHYNLPCVPFRQKTGYHDRTMYLPEIVTGKKVAIVDCMISTGGTVLSMIKALKSLPGTEISAVLCVNNKSNYGDNPQLLKKYNYKYLFDTHINEQDQVRAYYSKDLRLVFWEKIDRQFYQLAQDYATLSNYSKNGYQVGALIVAADTFEIAAWGYRRGHIHAEHDAISMLKNNCPDWEKRDFTLYTTLEPCVYRNGHGYTPCADLIMRVPQIRWVVIGSTDVADCKINGAGIKKLKNCKNIKLIENNQVIRCDEKVPHFLPQTVF